MHPKLSGRVYTTNGNSTSTVLVSARTIGIYSSLTSSKIYGLVHTIHVGHHCPIQKARDCRHQGAVLELTIHYRTKLYLKVLHATVGLSSNFVKGKQVRSKSHPSKVTSKLKGASKSQDLSRTKCVNGSLGIFPPPIFTWQSIQ